MKKNILLLLSLIFLLSACEKKVEIEEADERVYDKFTYNFFETFDTVVRTVIYAESQEKADEFNKYVEDRFNELHKEFNKYNSYEGINNVKTINDNAGIKPVEVSDDLFNLIKSSIDYYEKYDQGTDISFGAVLNIWSDYRDINEMKDPEKDYESSELIPSMEELKAAHQYTGIEYIELDEEKKTVFINNPNTQIDVGATAKGFAVELVGDEIRDLGCDSILISAGGNVKAIGQPLDGVRGKWGVGIQNPNILFPTEGQANIVETLFAKDISVVTSGDYQRYFIVDDVPYNHLIDKDSLMPGRFFRSVTIVCEDSALADFLSTAIFLMPYEEGKELVNSIDGVECLWINNDDSMIASEGLKEIMLSEGATGAK